MVLLPYVFQGPALVQFYSLDVVLVFGWAIPFTWKLLFLVSPELLPDHFGISAHGLICLCGHCFRGLPILSLVVAHVGFILPMAFGWVSCFLGLSMYLGLDWYLPLQGFVFLFWLLSSTPVVGYQASCGVLYFCTSFRMGVLLWAAVTLVLGFSVCEYILGTFDHVFGSLCLSKLCSLFPALLLTVLTLEISDSWHWRLHCHFWFPLCLADCITWILPIFPEILYSVRLCVQPSLAPCSLIAGFIALLWFLFLSLSCLLCHKD